MTGSRPYAYPGDMTEAESITDDLEGFIWDALLALEGTFKALGE